MKAIILFLFLVLPLEARSFETKPKHVHKPECVNIYASVFPLYGSRYLGPTRWKKRLIISYPIQQDEVLLTDKK